MEVYRDGTDNCAGQGRLVKQVNGVARLFLFSYPNVPFKCVKKKTKKKSLVMGIEIAARVAEN